MPTGSYEHPLLGQVTFKTKSSRWVRGDPITFTSGFEPKTEIEDVHVPQLVGVPGADGGYFPFHVRAHEQVKAAFAELESQGLLHHIKTFEGAFVPRLRRPTNGSLSKLPSNHAFGLELDINADDGTNGGSARPLEPVFSRHGFLWGQVFHDPMHFEVRLFRPDAPRSLPKLFSPPLAELSALVRQQAELFPGGLRHLELEVDLDGGFRLCIDGAGQTAIGLPSILSRRGERLTYQKVVELVNKNSKCPGVTA